MRETMFRLIIVSLEVPCPVTKLLFPFAGEDWTYVEMVARFLQSHGVSFFFDDYKDDERCRRRPPEVDKIPANILNGRSRRKRSCSDSRTIRFVLRCLLFPSVRGFRVSSALAAKA